MLKLKKAGEDYLKELDKEYDIACDWCPMDKLECTEPHDMAMSAPWRTRNLLQRVLWNTEKDATFTFETIAELVEWWLTHEDLEAGEVEDVREALDEATTPLSAFIEE